MSRRVTGKFLFASVSIHQAKGRHICDVIVEHFFHHHSSEKIIRWLTGEKSIGSGEATQNTLRLKQSYCCNDTATHLVSVALRNSAIAEKRSKALLLLRARGWKSRIFVRNNNNNRQIN